MDIFLPSSIFKRNNFLHCIYPHRYVITEEKSFYGKKSILRLRAAERSDTATFSCTATNPYGKAAEGLRLIVQGAPDPPDDIVFSDVRSTSVVAKWNIPYSGNSDISSYTINYHPVSGKSLSVNIRGEKYRKKSASSASVLPKKPS